MSVSKLKLIECPRDAMQGWPHFIPTQQKVAYINSLLKIGFDTIDFGSFVSPKAIPQMADTAEVLQSLNDSNSKLLAIIANERGAQDAVSHTRIDYLGFPFSISETFQQRNTNSSIKESFSRVLAIQELCVQHHKKLVVYISMGFGNPYGDPYDPEIVSHWVQEMVNNGIDIISIADTVGLATADQVYTTISKLIPAFPNTEIGVHLHSSPENRAAKMTAAYDAGCKRFDGAIRGIGGCPMAGDALVGNMDTEFMVDFFREKNANTGLDMEALKESSFMANSIFI